jgi:hypothetical protein
MSMKNVLRRFRYLLLLLAFVPITLFTVSDQNARSSGAADGAMTYVPVRPFLASDSHMHYLFAAISSAVFLAGAMYLLDRVRVGIGKLLSVGVFTGTLGVLHCWQSRRYRRTPHGKLLPEAAQQFLSTMRSVPSPILTQLPTTPRGTSNCKSLPTSLA